MKASLETDLEIKNLSKIIHPSKPLKYCWITVFSICTLVFLYQTLDRFRLLVDVPKSASVKLQFAEKLAFPAVTVCLGYRFRASIQKRFENIDIYGCYADRFECNWEFPWNMATATESIFKHCSFQRQWNCYPGIEAKGRWTRTLSSLGRCFTYKSGEYVYFGGDLNALEFTVDPQTRDKYEFLDFNGIRLYIHEDDEIPLFEITGTNINEGASAAFALELKRYNWIFDPKSNPCSTNASYTPSRCITKCIHETSMRLGEVNCRAPFMSVVNRKVCSTIKEIKALISAFERVVQNGTYWDQCTTSCPQDCVQTVYTPITASLGFTERKNESFIKIKIYIREMWLETITEMWDYSVDEFIADVGGSLNLFLGASFITIIQLTDFALAKFWRRLYTLVTERWKCSVKSEMRKSYNE